LALWLGCWLAISKSAANSRAKQTLIEFHLLPSPNFAGKATTKKSTIEKKKLKDFAYCSIKHKQKRKHKMLTSKQKCAKP
jgi:hypothetical protein